MKKIYTISLLILGMVMGIFQSSEAQVVQIASGGLYYPGGVSDNGVVSLRMGDTVYTWSMAGGLLPIGHISNGASFSGGAVISNDGTKISAGITNPANNWNEISLYDTGTQTWTYLGGLGASLDSSASSSWGMSADGSTIVGLGWMPGFIAHGVKWDAANGMVDIGSMFAGTNTRANAISDDKTVIVGWQEDTTGFWAGTRWVNGTEEFLTDSAGDLIGEAVDVSSDGATVVGSNGFNPYVWNETTGLQVVEHPGAEMFFRGGATGISGDGTKVIGYFRPWPGPPIAGEGFIWTPGAGRVNLNTYVAGLGIDTQGVTMSLPLAISRDGNKITGTGVNSSGQIVAFYLDMTDHTSVSENITQTVSVYPNPVSDVLYIKDATDLVKVEIYDMVGRKMVSHNATLNQVDVSFLQKGAYVLKVFAKGKNPQDVKFVKQ